jgi:hypothetical protein
MMKKLVMLGGLLWLSFWLVGCGLETDATTPTLEATLPPAPPLETAVTATPTTATITAEPTATQTAEPTPTATPDVTLPPTVTAEPSPTQTTAPATTLLSVNQPFDDTEVVVGSELMVGGRAQPGAGELFLRLQVVSRDIFTGTVLIEADGTWATAVTVPHHVTGPAELVVTSPLGEVVIVPLRLLPDPDMPGLTLRRPGPEDRPVAGYTLFFEGRALEPHNDTIRIGVLVEECTLLAVAQDITVSGGPWRGLLNLPPDVTGAACAVAYTGAGSISAPEGEWREARLPITILSSADAEALSISLGNPLGATFQAGQTAELFGVAVNALNNEVFVALILDDGQGTVLAEGVTTVDAFGFWEIDLLLPEDATGPALVWVRIGEGDSQYEIHIPTAVTP